MHYKLNSTLCIYYVHVHIHECLCTINLSLPLPWPVPSSVYNIRYVNRTWICTAIWRGCRIIRNLSYRRSSLSRGFIETPPPRNSIDHKLKYRINSIGILYQNILFKWNDRCLSIFVYVFLPKIKIKKIMFSLYYWTRATE